MAVTVGVDTWNTVAQADAYFASRPGSSAWFSLPTSASSGADSKEALLVTAFYWILYDATLEVAASANSDAVRYAQLEAVYFLLSFREEYEQREALVAQGVTQASASKWSETLSGVQKPPRIMAALSRAGLTSMGGNFVTLEIVDD